MFTVCPKFALTLVVTAADLKVAQGYVRCGRCSNVFNAIAALSEERAQVSGLEGYVQPDPPDERADQEKMEFDPAATKIPPGHSKPSCWSRMSRSPLHPNLRRNKTKSCSTSCNRSPSAWRRR